jgi:hypothetical protein
MASVGPLVRVDTKELRDASARMRSIGDGFQSVSDPSDFTLHDFGYQRLVDAVCEFTEAWRRKRARIHEELSELAQHLQDTAALYDQTDDQIRQSFDAGGEQPNGGGGAGESPQDGSGGSPQGDSGPAPGGVVGPGPNSGGHVPGSTPRPGGGTAWPTVPPMLGVPCPPVPGGPGTQGIWPYEEPGGPGLPWEDQIDVPPEAGVGSGVPDCGIGLQTPSGPDDLAFGLDQHATDLDRHAQELEIRAASLGPGPEADLLRQEAAFDRREASALRRILDHPSNGLMPESAPDRGVFISWYGPENPDAVVVVIGEPGGAGTFEQVNSPSAAAIAGALGEAGRDDCAVVCLQDYSVGDGLAGTPEACRSAAQTNAADFIGRLTAERGVPAENVIPVGVGLGAEAADAVSAPIGAVQGGSAQAEALRIGEREAKAMPRSSGHRGGSTTWTSALMMLSMMGRSMIMRPEGAREVASRVPTTRQGDRVESGRSNEI